MGLPRLGEASRSVVPRSRVRWLASAVALGIVGVAVSLTLIAGLSYDAAARSAAANDLPAARRQLDLAVTLDPSMALYARQRGIASLLMDDPDAAVADLARGDAAQSERRPGMAGPVDGPLRGGRQAGCPRCAESRHRAPAVRPDESAPARAMESEDGDLDALEGTAAEVLLAWPSVGAAPGWSDLTAGLSPDDADRREHRAMARWGRQPRALASVNRSGWSRSRTAMISSPTPQDSPVSRQRWPMPRSPCCGAIRRPNRSWTRSRLTTGDPTRTGPFESRTRRTLGPSTRMHCGCISWSPATNPLKRVPRSR